MPEAGFVFNQDINAVVESSRGMAGAASRGLPGLSALRQLQAHLSIKVNDCCLNQDASMSSVISQVCSS